MSNPEDEVRMLSARVDALSMDINSLQASIQDAQIALYGDISRHIPGLVQDVIAMRHDVSELVIWRREITSLMRVIAGLLGVGGTASIINVIQNLLKGV